MPRLRWLSPGPGVESYARFRSPLGTVEVTADSRGLCEVRFVGAEPPRAPAAEWRRGGQLVELAVAELEQYFAGHRREFDLPLAPTGSSFDCEVWRALGEVPFGVTVSYGELGARVGRPRAARAVGSAVHRNPIAIVVPCHRVIGSDGRLVGYAAGLERKAKLLTLEHAKFRDFARPPR